MELIHYVIVRRDLPLGVCASMLVHAAGESGALYSNPCDGRFRHAIAVILEAKNEDALHKHEEYLQSNWIQYVAVTESGGPYDGQLMALGLVPGSRGELSPLMSDFQTLKKLDNLTTT